MPKEIFNQIPLEKREKILRIAAMLFDEQGFARTNVPGSQDRQAWLRIPHPKRLYPIVIARSLRRRSNLV